MITDQDRTLKMVILVFRDWWGNMGELAAVLLAVPLLVAIAAMLLLVRWIWGGGLSRRSGFSFFRDSRSMELPVSGDSES